MSKLFQFQPGVFAREGERVVDDGHEWIFSSAGWLFAGGLPRTPPKPTWLWTRKSASDRPYLPSHFGGNRT